MSMESTTEAPVIEASPVEAVPSIEPTPSIEEGISLVEGIEEVTGISEGLDRIDQEVERVFRSSFGCQDCGFKSCRC
jgi:hypothetical protein